MQRCIVCHYRYSPLGDTCRTCLRDAGIDTRSVFEFERDRQARQAAKMARRQFAEEPPPRPVIREFVERGVTYMVIWNGSIR
jgi:hypothetical protein